ncbi:MAG: hypothetical protein PHQ43_05870 [Dehalococcoidales bacterium]|nr:hypothetical protein [Dehalococcoidales bacterium]
MNAKVSRQSLTNEIHVFLNNIHRSGNDGIGLSSRYGTRNAFTATHGKYYSRTGSCGDITTTGINPFNSPINNPCTYPICRHYVSANA